jgi:hypothetical protein
MSGSDGVILIYNPDAPAQDQQISDWVNILLSCTVSLSTLYFYLLISSICLSERMD